MKPIAIVTAEAARPLDEDLPPLLRALQATDTAHEVVCWDDPAVDWSTYSIVVLRSPWDYVPRLPAFLTWAEHVSQRTHLLNPLPVIRWNTDKHYLAELHRSGVAIVPSVFVAPGENAARVLSEFLSAASTLSQPFTEFVVKPCVGAGSKDAARYHRDDQTLALAHLAGLLDQGRGVMMQPYLDRVDADGETALIFFDGIYSHAIRKGPLLRRAAAPTDALFAAESISARQPDTDEIELAESAIALMRNDERLRDSCPLLYVRVDLLRGTDGKPCVLELETTEPSLFFNYAEGSAERFVSALRARL